MKTSDHMTVTPHNVNSSYREVLIQHLFIGELLRYLWTTGPVLAEVLEPQVDCAGYDLAIQVGKVVRHIQLKASHNDSATSSQKVHVKLAEKPSGCVIWVTFDKNSLVLGPYLWFGGAPGEPLPDISKLKVAEHTKANSKGHKGAREMIRVVSKGKFEKLKSIAEVALALFGQQAIQKEQTNSSTRRASRSRRQQEDG